MNKSSMSDVVIDILAPYLLRMAQDNRSIVIMTCGLAGSGKTTLAKAIQARYPSMHCLSIDKIICSKHGIYGVDYPASSSLYAKYQSKADFAYLSAFRTLLAGRKDVILERSFYAMQDRKMYRAFAEENGTRVVLVFLKAEQKEVLWEKIQKRSTEAKTASSALDIDRQTFDTYWDGFENPKDEE